MGFSKFTTSVNNISGLGNNVKNQAAVLKALFDKGDADQKVAFNSLIDELEAALAAASLGAKNPNGNTDSTVQAVLADLHERINTLNDGKEALIKNATAKDTPVDADLIAVIDSEGSNATKKTTFTRIKAFFKTYFDTLYNNYVLPKSTADVIGGVRPDGVTTTVDADGKITAVAADAADYTARGQISTHSGTNVNTEAGVHGIRFFNSKLSCYTGSVWTDVSNDTLENRVDLLESTIFNDITTNSFIILFDTTSDIDLSEGSHNSTTDVIEC